MFVINSPFVDFVPFFERPAVNDRAFIGGTTLFWHPQKDKGEQGAPPERPTIGESTHVCKHKQTKVGIINWSVGESKQTKTDGADILLGHYFVFFYLPYRHILLQPLHCQTPSPSFFSFSISLLLSSSPSSSRRFQVPCSPLLLSLYFDSLTHLLISYPLPLKRRTIADLVIDPR